MRALLLSAAAAGCAGRPAAAEAAPFSTVVSVDPTGAGHEVPEATNGW
jgi:hypothetical protein